MAPSDKMLSVREMAIMLETNPNTVAKAYKELERQKIIETIQGRGTFVLKNYTFQITDDSISYVKNTLKKVIIDTKYMGISKNQLVKMIDEIYDELGGNKDD